MYTIVYNNSEEIKALTESLTKAREDLENVKNTEAELKKKYNALYEERHELDKKIKHFKSAENIKIRKKLKAEVRDMKITLAEKERNLLAAQTKLQKKANLIALVYKRTPPEEDIRSYVDSTTEHLSKSIAYLSSIIKSSQSKIDTECEMIRNLEAIYIKNEEMISEIHQKYRESVAKNKQTIESLNEIIECAEHYLSLEKSREYYEEYAIAYKVFDCNDRDKSNVKQKEPSVIPLDVLISGCDKHKNMREFSRKFY